MHRKLRVATKVLGGAKPRDGFYGFAHTGSNNSQQVSEGWKV